MRKVIYAVFIGLAALLFGLTVANQPVTTHAAEIQVSGLGAADAIIKDENGQDVTNSTSFNKYQDYTINYNWSIPDGVQVAGNTSTVTVPAGLEPNADVSFDIKDASGTVVGTFKIQAGSSTGTITYNEAADGVANRKGTLSFFATGTSDNSNHGNGWNINKIGWIGNQNAQGVPTELVWNVAFNSQSAAIGNVTITDTLGPNQTFVPGSVSAPTGNYVNGVFVPDGGQATPTVSVNGSTIVFSFTNVNKAVDMRYTTTPTLVDGNGKWTNQAVSSNGGTVNATVNWGGSGTGSGDALGSVILNKTAADGSKLAGAVYKLVDAKGNVIIPELTTDANGQITVKDLPAGNYSLIEVTAPTGYAVNTMPHDFTIVAGVTTPVTVSALDDPDTDLGGVGQLGTVVVDKTGADGIALPGAVFQVLDATGKVIKDGLVTDDLGHVSLSGLAAGTYQLVETQAPSGYELAKQPVEFTIPEAGGTVNVPVSDQKTPDTGGSTTPPTGPTTPTEPGNPGPTTPTEPGNPNPGPTTPTEPGTPNPGPTTPTEPGKPNPGPEAPTEPGQPTPEPGNPTPGPTTPTTPLEPSNPVPGPAAPQEPQVPGVTTPGVGLPGQSGTGSATTPAGNGTSSAAAAGKLPQTGEQHSPWLAIIGLLSLGGLGLYGWLRKPVK